MLPTNEQLRRIPVYTRVAFKTERTDHLSLAITGTWRGEARTGTFRITTDSGLEAFVRDDELTYFARLDVDEKKLDVAITKLGDVYDSLYSLANDLGLSNYAMTEHAPALLERCTQVLQDMIIMSAEQSE